MVSKAIHWIENKMFSWIKKNVEYVVIGFLTLSIISPMLLTRNWGFIDLTATGQIGDTIGGLTAPILNCLSIVLLYLTLREQIISNNIITSSERRSRDYDIIFNMYDKLKDEIGRLEITIIKNGIENTYTGYRAIFEYKDVLEIKKDVKGSISEASLKAFSLSFSSLAASVFNLLSRSYKSNMSKDDKLYIFNALSQMKIPLEMVSKLAAVYAKQKGDKATELDKTVIVKAILLEKYSSEFNSHDPNKLE